MNSIIITCIILAFIFIMYVFFFEKNIEKILNLKDTELKNKKYELFSTIDSEKVSDIFNNYIDEYVTRYITYTFVASKAVYIKDKEVTDMINNVTKNIVIDMSELYLFYAHLLYSINNTDDLVSFIKNKVSNSVIEFVANYNSQFDEI